MTTTPRYQEPATPGSCLLAIGLMLLAWLLVLTVGLLVWQAAGLMLKAIGQ